MSDKIISMADKANDATFQSPKQALEDALNDTGKEGALKKGKKVLILAIDDTDGCYDISWYQAGMKMSECLTLCEVSKAKFLEEIGY